MLGYDSKDSRLQVTMSLSCSVSAIFDGRILIDSIHCILSHQLFYSYIIGVRDKVNLEIGCVTQAVSLTPRHITLGMTLSQVIAKANQSSSQACQQPFA